MMQQIQLSPVKFSEEEIAQQQQELDEKISLLINTVAIDEITLLFFYPEGEVEIQPQAQFCAIISRNIPPAKANQIDTIQRLTFCFYSMLVQSRLENLPAIQMHYQRYLQRTTYSSVFVGFHQKIRKWCKQLFQYKDFTKSKQNLSEILSQIKQNDLKRLEILVWKINVCLKLFDVISGKNKIERIEIIKLLKSFKNLKKQNKISTKPILEAFKFMIDYFISQNNDLYMFFARQIKLWVQQIVDNSLIAQMKSIVHQCQKMSAQVFKPTAEQLVHRKTLIERKAKPSKAGRKIVMNTLNPHLFYQSNPTLISGRRLIRRRPSRQQEDQFQKKIDHFFKTRNNNIKSKSVESTPRVSRALKVSIKISQKHSLSLHSINRFMFDQANIYKNTLKTEEKRSEVTLKQTSRVSLSASKSASSFYKKGGIRKRRQMYQKIMQNDGNKKLITNKHLKDQMFLMYQVEQERCKITLEEILIGQFKKTQADPNVKFIGVSQDNEFGDLSLSFFTIFNQQLAQIFFRLRKVSKQGYILSCKTRSTYCNYPAMFSIDKKQTNYREFTFDDLNESLVNSIIYYEALQEKVQRTIGVSQVQAMQELLREFLGVQLSQSQLTKLLVIVDLFESYFFWYYTKGNYINGCRLQKRANMEFEDLSAFAVSLGKFKSDYDSCLNQIILVENTKSLKDTCIYLSHGRKIVYKAMRKLKGNFYLEVVSISDEVYKSFSRKDKIPFFRNTYLQRKLLRADQFTQSDSKITQDQWFFSKKPEKIIDLHQIFAQEDVFIFFMKNIVQNFIQIKYIHKIERYLLGVNKKQSIEIYNERDIVPYQRFNLQIITNNEELCELRQFKPIIHSSIKHLRQILLKFCEAYDLNLSFTIVSKREHFLNIQKKSYVAREIQLSNSLKIVSFYKRGKRQQYDLFLYHQKPKQFAILNCPFHKRFVMIDQDSILGNLLRKSKAQMFLSDDCSSVTKHIIKYEQGYCYINVSQCQSIICWRFDYYFPLLQEQYSTFLDEQIYLECLAQWSKNEQMWKQTINKIKIKLQQKQIHLHSKKIKLFKSIRRLYYGQNHAQGLLQLIELSGQLFFLINNFESGTLSIGNLQNIDSLYSKSFFSLTSSSKEKVGMYDNIMNLLLYKVSNGKLPSEIITADYFINDDET